jgi:hypothetical protein
MEKKKDYTAVECDVVAFESADVLTASPIIMPPHIIGGNGTQENSGDSL